MNDAEFDALRDSLHEYDPTVTRCRGIVHATGHETDGFEEPYIFTYEATCVRPRGHRGVCTHVRPSIGWPGYRTLRTLVDAYDRLRDESSKGGVL